MLYILCDKSPAEFWDYTQAETAWMIEKKIKGRELQDKIELIKFADIKCTIMNASVLPYLKKGDKFPYKLDDFLPKDMRTKPPVTSEYEKTKRWLEAGKAMMKVVEEHEKETGVKV